MAHRNRWKESQFAYLCREKKNSTEFQIDLADQHLVVAVDKNRKRTRHLVVWLKMASFTWYQRALFNMKEARFRIESHTHLLRVKVELKARQSMLLNNFKWLFRISRVPSKWLALTEFQAEAASELLRHESEMPLKLTHRCQHNRNSMKSWVAK